MPRNIISTHTFTGADGRREPGLDDMVRRMRG